MVPRRVHVRVLAGCRGRVRPGEVRRIAAHVLGAEGLDPGVEVEVVLAGAPAMRDLNRLYRGRDAETDVLSFSAREGEPFVGSPDEAPSLGEVIVCLPVAERQAAAAGRPVAGEVAHLLTHGLLHLLAYDHEEAAGAARMRSREDALLSALGYAGQYEHGH